MIKAAIDEDNKAHPGQVIFVDTIPKTFAGHEPDPSVLRRNPNRWLSEFLEPGFDPNEWYHPNSKGANAYTTALATKLEEDKSADYLQNVKKQAAMLMLFLILTRQDRCRVCFQTRKRMP